MMNINSMEYNLLDGVIIDDLSKDGLIESIDLSSRKALLCMD